ncbi:uncharacterized protein LOC143707230 isoform X2 [Siphateles boraxobius]|uniref:uncharacterized protein LOC143707230 isoform X2 n=1 Tax=Siphateles boraxobius TaxID=180520 RepID=UPI0040636D1C
MSEMPRMNSRVSTQDGVHDRSIRITILKEMGLADKVSTARARKKWKNLTKKFKELKQSPSGVETKSGDTVAINWKWFELMNEAIGWRLSLISSASPNYCSTELLETDESDPGFSPLPPTRQHKDPVLEFLEREAERSEARERRAEEREEKLLNLLERIVDKM